MKIVFMGTPDFAVPSLKALYESGEEIAAVFTQTDKPKGRGNKLAFSPVKEFALAHDIKVYQPASLKRETEVYTPIINEINPDVIVVVAYGKILPPEVLSIPKLGCVNVHGSLLPKYRGAAPIQWTVLNGDEYGGITTMLMAEGLDTGDMLLKQAVKVENLETAAEYFDRLSAVGAELLLKTLAGLEAGEITPIKQDEAEATYAPMLSKEMCPIDFSVSCEEVYNKIQGLSDWPCATCIVDGKKLKIYRCEKVKASGQPATVINPADFTVACGSGAVRFLEVQAEGSKRMSAADYLRGHPISKNTIIN